MINRYFTVLGIDPSISHFGLVYGFFDADTREFVPLLTKTIVNDVNPTDYPHLNATELKAYKAWKMGMRLHYFINQEHSCDGLTGKIKIDPDIIIFELSNGSNKSFVEASLSCVKGVVAGVFSILRAKRLFMPSTSKVKTITGNPNNATKEQMIAWAVQKYGCKALALKTEEIKLYVRDVSDMCYEAPYGTSATLSYNEHIADAVAAIEAKLNGIETKTTERWASEFGRSKDSGFNAIRFNFKIQKIQEFQKELPKVRNEVTRLWEEEVLESGETALNPCLTSRKKVHFGWSEKNIPSWDNWISRERYSDACKYRSSKIKEVYVGYGQHREVFFSDAVLIDSIRKLGYVNFLGLLGLFNPNYEEQLNRRLDTLEKLKDYLREVDIKKILASFRGVNASSVSLKSLLDSTSEDDKIEVLSRFVKEVFPKIFETLKNLSQRIRDDEGKYIEQSLFILRELSDDDWLSSSLGYLRSQSKEDNPEIDYRSYYLSEAELLKALLNNARIAQKGAGKVGECKKEAVAVINKLIEDFGLSRKVQFDTDTNQIERKVKKKTGPKPKAKPVAHEAPSVPARGRGRPKGSKNKKTLERERLLKVKEKQEEVAKAIQLANERKGNELLELSRQLGRA